MKARFVLVPLLAAFLAMGGDCRNLDTLNPCVVSGVVQDVPISRIDSVDVLFVIDNSESMQEEQLELSSKITNVVQALVDGGGAISDPGGLIPDFPPVESLRVGVVTTDIGSVPFVGTAAGQCDFGTADNAELFTTGIDRTPPPPDELCELYPGEDPAPLNYAQFPLDPFFPAGAIGQSDFVNGVECIVGQGTDGDFGCGYEQQLEATLRALNGSVGVNEGFIRDEALLAIILVTDEDDCSAEDPDIYDVSDNAANQYKGPYTAGMELKAELRCFEHKQALWDIERYATAFADLKDSPSKIVFAAIAGIPLGEFSSLDAILNDPNMVEVPDGPDTSSQKLRPSCDAGANGEAFPARRIVETAKGLEELGVRSIVESICEDDYTGLLGDIVAKIGDALRQICLPRPLIRSADGKVGCEVTETQLAGVTCESVGKGRTFLRNDEDEPDREVCLIEQLPTDGATTPTGLGWFYDDFSTATDICTFDTAQRVSFTDNSEPAAGVSVRFECLQGIQPAEPDIGFPCTPDTAGTDTSGDPECDDSANEISLEDQYDLLTVTTMCQSATNTCQIKCNNDAECPGGFVCFTPEGGGDDFCLNPTCTLN